MPSGALTCFVFHRPPAPSSSAASGERPTSDCGQEENGGADGNPYESTPGPPLHASFALGKSACAARDEGSERLETHLRRVGGYAPSAEHAHFLVSVDPVAARLLRRAGRGLRAGLPRGVPVRAFLRPFQNLPRAPVHGGPQGTRIPSPFRNRGSFTRARLDAHRPRVGGSRVSASSWGRTGELRSGGVARASAGSLC